MPDGALPSGQTLSGDAGIFDRNLYSLREEAQKKFSVLWLSGAVTKADAYAWLAEAMGLDPAHCFISRFERSQCCEVLRLCTERKRALIDAGVMDSPYVSLRVPLPDGETICPTCGRLFSKGKLGRRTRGHLVPAFAKRRGFPRYYIYQCFDCNTRQGERTLREMRADLADPASTDRRNRPRADGSPRGATLVCVDRLIAQLTALGLDENDF